MSRVTYGVELDWRGDRPIDGLASSHISSAFLRARERRQYQGGTWLYKWSEVRGRA
jgi:hypothetical protein